MSQADCNNKSELNMGVLNDVSGVIVYHVVRIPKRQYEVNETPEFPFSERDFSSAPPYKQEAENLLEQARLNEFPEYPSRKDCLFVARNREDMDAWVHYKYKDDCDFVLYKILLEKGKLIWLDTEWYEGAAELLAPGNIVLTHNKTLPECISNYWNGVPYRKNGYGLIEGLFYGTAKILSKDKYQIRNRKIIKA